MRTSSRREATDDAWNVPTTSATLVPRLYGPGRRVRSAGGPFLDERGGENERETDQDEDEGQRGEPLREPQPLRQRLDDLVDQPPARGTGDGSSSVKAG